MRPYAESLPSPPRNAGQTKYMGGNILFLYTLNMPSNQEEIARLECLMITGVRAVKNYALSSRYADIKDAAYLDLCIEIYFESDTIESLYKKIDGLNYDRDNFRVRFINTGTHIDFHERKSIERKISDIFMGWPDLKNPADDFIVTAMEDRWMFGKVKGICENRWLLYKKMPHTFCNSLPARIARGLVNAAACGKRDLKFLDPCCGMGNVVIEALDMGIDAEGFDFNDIVVEDANSNLNFFGFDSVIKCADASKIKGSFDTAVADLPYGVLSITDRDTYFRILKNLRSVASRAVILSAEDISDIVISVGFDIIEKCIAHKGGLDRHITVCR